MNQQDIRDKMCNQLLMNGSATVSEILAASFGEWPLRGLDIVAQPEHPVKFTDLFVAKEVMQDGIPNAIIKVVQNLYSSYTSFGHHKMFDGEHRIWINQAVGSLITSLLGKRPLSQSMGHEVVHALQNEHTNNVRDNYGSGDMYYNCYNPISPSLLRAEHLSVAKSAMTVLHQETEERPGNKFLQKIGSQIRSEILMLGRSSYLNEGIEVQARVNEMMIKGYPHWPHLPQSKEELWAAVIDVGMKPPEDIMAGLNQSPAFLEARKAFNGAKADGLSVAFEMNRLVRALPTDKQNAFWQEVLPVMYADLIEMMGDREGRARMGLGDNHRAAVMMFGPIMDGTIKFDAEKIMQHTELLGPYHAAGFVVGKLGHFDRPDANPIVLKVLETMGKVPGVIEAMDQFADGPEDKAAIHRFADRVSGASLAVHKPAPAAQNNYQIPRVVQPAFGTK